MENKKLSIEQIVNSSNIVNLLDTEHVVSIGQSCMDGYQQDLSSRSEWDQRNAQAFKLALQVREDKTYPWPGASNVKFPLISVAAIQFHARAYPALVPPTGLIKAQVFGPDFDGENSKRAERIGAHMTWQMMDETSEWERNHDKALLVEAIVGTVFKKTYFDSVAGRNRYQLVMAKDLVINYWTTTIEEAPRATHIIQASSNEIREKVIRKIYIDAETDVSHQRPPISTASSELEEAKDMAQGLQKPIDGTETPITLLEQHCWIDLDGDGYKEPYVVTLREIDGTVLRIVARFMDQGDVIRLNDDQIKSIKMQIARTEDDKEKLKLRADIIRLKSEKHDNNPILRINPIKVFTKYGFIPSPDGGFYDLGLGSLLGPVNESVDTAINQLIDAGTLNNLGGGFLGPGVSIKSGVTERDPGSWIPLSGRGDDVRKAMVPFPQNQPSEILYKLMELLITYGERLAGSTEIMTGVSPGQNTPAETSRNTVEQGMKVFSAIHKRNYLSMKEEAMLVYNLNRLYLNNNEYFIDLTTGKSAMIQKDDYEHDMVSVVPCADPHIVSDSQRLNQAAAVLQFAQTHPGVNLYEAGKRYLEALRVSGISILYPDPKGPNAVPPPVNPKLQIEQIKQETKKAELQLQAQELQFDMQKEKIELQGEVEKNQAEIVKLQAETVKILADAKGVDQGHQIALIDAQIGAAKEHKDRLVKLLELLSRHHLGMNKLKENEDEPAGTDGVAAKSSDQRSNASIQ